MRAAIPPRSFNECGGGSLVSAFDDLVQDFLTHEKIAKRGPRWRTVTHPDYAEASIPVTVPNNKIFRGRVILTAHRLRNPYKFSFSMVFKNERILALDVNPARSHRNLFTPATIKVTHWQRWPHMEAEPDPRDFGFSRWLHEFLNTANVTCNFRVGLPPTGVQLDWTKWPHS